MINWFFSKKKFLNLPTQARGKTKPAPEKFKSKRKDNKGPKVNPLPSSPKGFDFVFTESTKKGGFTNHQTTRET